MKFCARFVLVVYCMLALTGASAQQNPNIIYILADDLGYGDLSALNKNSKLHTKNIDAIAAAGMSFTDAHSNSAVCTPTRYGILTGRYAWRTRLQSGVLWSYDSMLIKNNRTTIASLLQKHGYSTACIGKWHLGLNWQKDDSGKADLNKEISAGPNQAGFDYFYGITASLDIPPYVYIENNRVTTTFIDSINGNPGKGFWRPGPIGSDFKHEEVLPRLTQKATDYISTKAGSGRPFFLFFSLPSPHTPMLPSKEYRGKSGTNEYGDFVLMTDDMVGKILQSVKDAGIENNTIIVFTSDNGVTPVSGIEEMTALGHQSSYRFRGAKADIYEGGHRVPFLIKWPGKIKANLSSDATVCLTDFFATTADLIGKPLSSTEGEDSYSLLPLLLRRGNYQRTSIVHHSIEGNFSIRQGKWKLAFAYGSGGWSYPTEKKAKSQAFAEVQLFDLTTDLVEQNNLAKDNPALVQKMSVLLSAIIENGRSTAGAKQVNDSHVDYLKYK